jgi:hypothetical protein
VHQAVRGQFDLRMVIGPQWTEQGEAEMLADLGDFTGSTPVAVHHVDEIPLVRTGKRTAVISEVPLDFQQVSRRTERQDG